MLQPHHVDGLEYPPGIRLYSVRPSSSPDGSDAPAVFEDVPGYKPPKACIRRSAEVADDILGRRGISVLSVDVRSGVGIVSAAVDVSSDVMLDGRGYVNIVFSMNKIGMSTMVYGSSLLDGRWYS